MRLCLLIGLSLLFFACASVGTGDPEKLRPFPPCAVVVQVLTPRGPGWLHLPMGTLDERYHGTWWWTEEEWQELMLKRKGLRKTHAN